MHNDRPGVLITGVGRCASIGTEIARQLAADGWNIAITSYKPDHGFVAAFTAELESLGLIIHSIEADMAEVVVTEAILREATYVIGPISALVSSHALCINSSILNTTQESFDNHFAVNTRANWLLIRAFAELYTEPHGVGRIVALTSDHTAHKLDVN